MSEGWRGSVEGQERKVAVGPCIKVSGACLYQCPVQVKGCFRIPLKLELMYG